MKYDILVPNFLRLKRRQSLSVDIFTVQEIIFAKKKSGSLSQKLGGKNGKNPFQAILRLEKKRKWHGPLIY